MLTELQIRKFTKLFTIYDIDNTGHIALADFERVVHRIAEIRGWKSNSPKIAAMVEKFAYYWIHLKSQSDKNRDNKVSLDEWLEYYDVLLNDPQRYKLEVNSLINLIFDVFDVDGDGSINKHEWIDFMGVYHNHRIYAEKAFSQIDLDKDGLLSKDEFLKALYDFHYSNEENALGNLLFTPY